jgi:hypothetical protein
MLGGRRLLGVVVSVAAIAAACSGSARAAAADSGRPPSAAEFARRFVAAVNVSSDAKANRRRIVHADCVQAARGRYMCSYATIVPNDAAQCHIMQAAWTPTAASVITVTLAGRTRFCGSLRQALQSLP